jgi:hypothetical protein
VERAERRRQLKDDRRIVARGLPGGKTDLEMIVSLMRVLHDLVEEARDAGTVAPLMAFFQENMTAAGRPGPTKALACRRGCSHCCYAWVSARAPEILFAKKAVPGRATCTTLRSAEIDFCASRARCAPSHAGLALLAFRPRQSVRAFRSS